MAGGATRVSTTMDPESTASNLADTGPALAGPEQPMWDCSCQVSRVPSQMGLVRALRFLDAARDSSAYVGRPLSALLGDMGLAGADECARAVLDACSARGVHVQLPRSGARFCIVSAGVVEEHSVHLAVRCIDSDILPELVEARVAQVAESSGLSDRERQVLQLLLRGRGVEDIATMLEIAPRTVKFHQANVLHKLGADSRADLLRVVL